jgi:hypothetical protein
VVYKIRFNEEKNQLLKILRQICFDEAIQAISEGRLLADIVHTSKERPSQRIYVIDINGYAYALPYIKDDKKKEIFLKTLYPSRVLTKKYIGGRNEKNKK